jgi:hypothetical protein
MLIGYSGQSRDMSLAFQSFHDIPHCVLRFLSLLESGSGDTGFEFSSDRRSIDLHFPIAPHSFSFGTEPSLLNHKYQQNFIYRSSYPTIFGDQFSRTVLLETRLYYQI